MIVSGWKEGVESGGVCSQKFNPLPRMEHTQPYPKCHGTLWLSNDWSFSTWLTFLKKENLVEGSSTTNTSPHLPCSSLAPKMKSIPISTPRKALQSRSFTHLLVFLMVWSNAQQPAFLKRIQSTASPSISLPTVPSGTPYLLADCDKISLNFKFVTIIGWMLAKSSEVICL